MPTHVYCLTSAPDEPPPGLAGLGGAPVRAIGAAPLRAWVSTVPAPPPAASAEAARVHDAVVDAALATGTTPVPARFGQRYESDAECLTVLARHAGEMTALLARVDGLVEMTVVARLEDAAVSDRGPARDSDSAPGHAYLARRKAELASERNVQRLAAAVQRRIHDAVQPLARDEVARLAPAPGGGTLSLSHLVPRDAVAEYRRTVANCGTDPDLPPCVTLGPHAPYRFVRLPDAHAS